MLLLFNGEKCWPEEKVSPSDVSIIPARHSLRLPVNTMMLAAALVAIMALVCHVLLSRHWSAKEQLPPGPKPAPLVANALQLPAEYQERTYLEWGRQFGTLGGCFCQHLDH